MPALSRTSTRCAVAENGSPAIAIAAQDRARLIAELLLARGADPDRKGSLGDSAMKWANKGSDPEMLELLRRYARRPR